MKGIFQTGGAISKRTQEEREVHWEGELSVATSDKNKVMGLFVWFFFWLLLLVFLLLSSNQWLDKVWKSFVKDDYNYRKRGRRVVFMCPFRDEAQFLLVTCSQ